MTEPLHLVSFDLDPAGVFGWSRARRLQELDGDLGYAVHATLKAVFQDRAPRPFRVVRYRPRSLHVLAYSVHTAATLSEHARAFAAPEAFGACRWSDVVSKPMPTRFAAGQRLGFEVRACPVRRIAQRGPLKRERAEVDAFLARSWEAGDAPVDRETVYRDWVAEELKRSEAATVAGLRVASWTRVELHRQDHGEPRHAHSLQRPDVLVDGELVVESPAGFARLLARGLGRHRAFGFGMVLLRPPRGTG